MENNENNGQAPENESKKYSKKEINSKVLNVLLSIIVVITLVTGAVIYYSLYKYTKIPTQEDKTVSKSTTSSSNKVKTPRK